MGISATVNRPEQRPPSLRCFEEGQRMPLTKLRTVTQRLSAHSLKLTLACQVAHGWRLAQLAMSDGNLWSKSG